MKIDKYALYQEAVQDPDRDVELYQGFYKKLRGRPARSLREDFCGTFVLSCSWVKAHSLNRAHAIDLDPEPLDYGKSHGFLELTPAQRARLRIERKNVMSTIRGADLIVAGNFSFYIFQQRETLLAYFKHCRRSLVPGRGALILDMAGGPEMIRVGTEHRTIRSRTQGRYRYSWELKSFDPVSNRARFAIHFERAGGRKLRDAFTYDWRMWSIPEVRELLVEAGFKRTAVLWDVAPDDRDENYVVREHGDDAECWLAYVVGLA